VITASHVVRQKVITYSSGITADPSDVIAVVVGAGPLLDWLEAAVDEDDFARRLAAMERYYANCFFGSSRSGMSPEEFVRATRTLYLYAINAIVPEYVPDALPPEAA
jgi:hypothetical protein